MAKKNSMYINDYEVLGYMVTISTEESKQEYLDYLQSLINDLQDLKTYAENMDTKSSFNMFYECQSKLITHKNKLNASSLAKWHINIGIELQREVEELRKR